MAEEAVSNAQNTQMTAANGLPSSPVSAAEIATALESSSDAYHLTAWLDELGKCTPKPSPEYAGVLAIIATKTVFDATGGASQALSRVLACQPLAVAALVEQLSVLNSVQGPKADPRALARAEAVANAIATALSTPQTLYQSWNADPRETASLYCGSRLLSTAAATPAGRQTWLGDSCQYVRWLGTQLTEFGEIPPDLFDRALKLGNHNELLPALFAKNGPAVVTVYKKLRPFARSYALRQILMWVQDRASVAAIGALWMALEPDNGQAALVLAGDPLFGVKIQRAAALSITPAKLASVLQKEIGRWGAPSYIGQCSFAKHRAETQVLLSCIVHLKPSEAMAISRSPEHTQAVTAHLSQNTSRIRNMGAVVAEALSRRAGEDLRFEINHEDENWSLTKDEPVSLQNALDEITKDLNGSDSGRRVNIPSVADPEDMAGLSRGINEAKEQRKKEPKPQFDSDDEDDPEVVPPPLFANELASLLAATDNFAKIDAALRYGPPLLRRKAGFGTEVQASATALLRATAALGDTFAMPNFSERRQNLLTAIVVADPQQGPAVVRLAAGGDYSLFQRLSLLNTLVLAAKELASGTSSSESDFPSERLPPQLEAAFLAFSNETDKISSHLQDQLVLQTRDDAAERASHITKSDKSTAPLIQAGKVLRVSRALEKQRQQAGKQRAQKANKFSKIAGQLFFFPLVAAGNKGAFAFALTTSQQSSVQYTEMLYSAWVRTLALLVYYATPCNDLGEMVAEFVKIWLAGRVYRSTSVSALDALYTSILILSEQAGALMVERHAQQLAQVAEWISDTWKAIPDDRVQKLGAAALLRLEEQRERLMEKFIAQ